MRFWLVLVLALWAEAATVLRLANITYFSPDLGENTMRVGSISNSETVLPVTYFNSLPLSVEDLEQRFAGLLADDDVLSEPFLSRIVLPTGSVLPKALDYYFKSKGIKTFVSNTKIAAPTGPYFLHPFGHLTRVYRLYVDYNMAFVQGVIESSNGSYTPCTAAAGEPANGAISVPVPSRHYYPKPSAKQPLSGVRLGVKDIFDLKGMKTGAGSRAFFELYPPAEETACSLQLLIDMGAVVVGKLKTTQFAAGETPTAQYVDQLAPFNPRGDGYQSPAASSCGTGAAMASYDWLDLGTASDTGGSVRFPAAANGLFGMRITNASLPLEGIVPITPKMDTPGLIARDAKLLQTAHKNWFKAKSTYKSFPKRIILPDEFWPSPDNFSMPLLTKFVNDLAALLGAEIEHVNTNQSFIDYTGYKAGFQDFVGSIPLIHGLDQWEGIGKTFIADYEERFGRYPYEHPAIRVRHGVTLSITPEAYLEALRRVQLYREWYTSRLITSCEDSLVIYPGGNAFEYYRDDTLQEAFERSIVKGPVPLYHPISQAPYAGLPDYAIPIGTKRYNSTVTLREEELPLSVGIIGGAGCDHMLLDLVVKLGQDMEGFKTKVKTGRLMQ